MKLRRQALCAAQAGSSEAHQSRCSGQACLQTSLERGCQAVLLLSLWWAVTEPLTEAVPLQLPLPWLLPLQDTA